MYPIDVSSLMHRSLHGMNADDPTVPYTPSLARRLALALRSRPARAAGVVAIAPSAPSWERTADRTRRCA